MSSTHVIPSNRTVYTEHKIHIIECANCSMDFGIGSDFMARRREDHQGFYCPNGHSNYYPGATQQEKELAAAKDQLQASRELTRQERDRRVLAERERDEISAEDARLRWRVANGVCPCCHRRFPQLADHMAIKHPDFATYPFAALSHRMVVTLAGIARTVEHDNAAVVDGNDFDGRSIRALVVRGLVTGLGQYDFALTDAGWRLVPAALQQLDGEES